MISNTIKTEIKFFKKIENFNCDVYCLIKPQNYFKIQEHYELKRCCAKSFFPEQTFHPLIIMLLAETKVKNETERVLALWLSYQIILQ